MEHSLHCGPGKGPSLGAIFIALSMAAGAGILTAQSPIDGRTLLELKRLFPLATSFGPKSGDPPHFNAYVGDPKSGKETVAGFAFLTTDLEPLERGYEGPIKILVGMNTRGVLAGISVLDNHEPYGYFSIEPPQFAAQFAGKSVRDPFRVGDDIDAVSRASISVSSATRAVRNSARRAARALLTPADLK